jgi:hypothetical protein
MRPILLSLAAAITLLGQGTTQTAPMPNPYGPSTRTAVRPNNQISNRNRVPIRRPFIGAGFGTQEIVVVEKQAPVKEDPLKDLIVSPVYQRDKITPKMIEIP